MATYAQWCASHQELVNCFPDERGDEEGSAGKNGSVELKVGGKILSLSCVGSPAVVGDLFALTGTPVMGRGSGRCLRRGSLSSAATRARAGQVEAWKQNAWTERLASVAKKNGVTVR